MIMNDLMFRIIMVFDGLHFMVSLCNVYAFMTLHRPRGAMHTFSLLAFPYLNSELFLGWFHFISVIYLHG